MRTRFVTNRNSVGFACKTAQTISFVERGFERLGLGYQAVGFSWCSGMVKLFSSLESSSWRWAGGLWFLAIFPPPLSRLLTLPFILACIRCPSSTCRVNLSETDICPISLYPNSLGVVVKAEEYGSVRCRVLNGSKGSFPWIFQIFFQVLILYRFCPFFQWVYGSVEDWTVLGCIPRLSCALYFWAWAIALLSLGFWTPYE